MSYSKQDVINELRKAKNLTELVEIKNKLSIKPMKIKI